MPSAAPAVLLHSLHTQQGVCNIVIAMTRRDFVKPAFSLRKKHFVKTHALSLLGTTRLLSCSECSKKKISKTLSPKVRNNRQVLPLRDRSRVVPRSDRACVFTKRFLRSENAGFTKSRRVIAITMLHTPCWTKPLSRRKKNRLTLKL